MPDKQPANKSVAVRQDTYDRIVEIKKMPVMLSEEGLQPNYTEVIDKIVEFFYNAHQKGKR